MEILITCKFYFNKADFLKRALEISFASPSTNPTFKDGSAENPSHTGFPPPNGERTII